MPYDKRDPALAYVKKQIDQGVHPQDAYYDIFKPNRNKTISESDYNSAVVKAVSALKGTFSRCEVQGETWDKYSTPREAATNWATTGGWDFLHIHRADDAAYRVYIPADLRCIGDIISIIWDTPGLTGFKVAGYTDANNRSDVIVAWVKSLTAVNYIASYITSDMLHGMRPPGSSIIKVGCLIGYSQEVKGSSVGTEVVRDLTR